MSNFIVLLWLCDLSVDLVPGWGRHVFPPLHPRTLVVVLRDHRVPLLHIHWAPPSIRRVLIALALVAGNCGFSTCIHLGLHPLVVGAPRSLIINGRYLGHYLKIGLVGAATEVYDGVAEHSPFEVLGAPHPGTAPFHRRDRLRRQLPITVVTLWKPNLIQNLLKVGESVLIVHLEFVFFELLQLTCHQQLCFFLLLSIQLHQIYVHHRLSIVLVDGVVVGVDLGVLVQVALHVLLGDLVLDLVDGILLQLLQHPLVVLVPPLPLVHQDVMPLLIVL